MVLLYGGHLGETIIYGNTDLSINTILESRDLFLSYIHIGLHTSDAKYGIQPSKTEMVTNINFDKITVRIESYEILEVTEYEGEIHLLTGIKYTVTVKDTGSPILTTPHSTSLVFCETNVRDPQYKTDADKNQNL